MARRPLRGGRAAADRPRVRRAVRATDRPPDPRAARSTPRSSRTTRRSASSPARIRSGSSSRAGLRRSTRPARPSLDPAILSLGVPVLGICFGMQAMAQALGGEVGRTGTAEFGKTELGGVGGMLFEGLGDMASCWMSHNNAVTACRTASSRRPRRRRRRSRRWRRPRAGSTPCSSTRGAAHPARQRAARQLPEERRGAPARGRPRP